MHPIPAQPVGNTLTVVKSRYGAYPHNRHREFREPHFWHFCYAYIPVLRSREHNMLSTPHFRPGDAAVCIVSVHLPITRQNSLRPLTIFLGRLDVTPRRMSRLR